MDLQALAPGKKIVTGGYGNPEAEVVFIGESPTPGELAKGEASKQVLKVLGDVFPDSFDADNFYYLNAIPFLVPKMKDAKKNLELTQKAALKSHKYLNWEIDKHPRKVVVCLGNAAMWTLTGDVTSKITRIRGQVQDNFHGGEHVGAIYTVMPSVHPSFLMRGGGSYQKFKRDINYALDLANGIPRLEWEIPEYWVAQDEGDVDRFIAELSADAERLDDYVIGADIETGGFDHMDDEILCIGMAIDPNKVYIVDEDLMPYLQQRLTKNAPFLSAKFLGGKYEWVWHNGKFDIKFLRTLKALGAGVDHDTMLMSYCLDPETPVLKDDMTYVPISKLQVGDTLVGFDEHNSRAKPGTVGSHFKSSTVTGLKLQNAPKYRITTSFGSVTCSGKHMWAVRRYGQRVRKWVNTETLHQSEGKAELSLFMEPVHHTLSEYEIGYMSAILDGEGHASYTEQNKSWQVGFSQKPGKVLDRCIDLLDRTNIEYTIVTHPDQPVTQVRFSGGRAQLQALGLFKPIRLMSKLPAMWQGNRKCIYAEILDVEWLGVGEVIGIETSTRTLIASGYMSHNCMEERGGFHDLDQVAADELGAPYHKEMLDAYLPSKKHSYRDIPRPVLWEYLAYDVSKTKGMFRSMYPRILRDSKNTKLYHDVLLPASDLLADVEWNGMLVDWGKQKENVGVFTGVMEEHHAALNAIVLEIDPSASYKTSGTKAQGGGRILAGINPNSPKQLGVLLYDKLRLAKTNKGTGADILEKLPPHPVVTALQKYRKAAKAFGTYVKPLPEQVSSDGRVHSTYLIHGTATGRLSSRGPNMQNQPRDPRIRGQFKAADGFKLCEMDLDQAELRCLAALSGDASLCHIYETEGLSLHKVVSVELWGEDWTRRYKIDTPGDPEYDQAKEEYMRTKALNFGIVYGREAGSIAQEFEIPIEEAQAMVDGWARQFPDAWKFIGKCRNAPIKGQNLVTPFGRRKRAGVIAREKIRDLQNEASNFPHQSIASDITLMSAVKVRPWLAERRIKIVNLVHDAIIVEYPDDQDLFIEMARHVTAEMEKTPIEWGIDRIPFSADAKTGIRWGELRDTSFR